MNDTPQENRKKIEIYADGHVQYHGEWSIIEALALLQAEVRLQEEKHRRIIRRMLDEEERMKGGE